MNGLNFQRMMLSGILILALGACVHKPTKSMKMDTPIEIASPAPQQGVLLQEARSEAESLRAELASLKILMAKQTGELQALREQSQRIQYREHDQGQELQKHSEPTPLLTSRARSITKEKYGAGRTSLEFTEYVAIGLRHPNFNRFIP